MKKKSKERKLPPARWGQLQTLGRLSEVGIKAQGPDRPVDHVLISVEEANRLVDLLQQHGLKVPPAPEPVKVSLLHRPCTKLTCTNEGLAGCLDCEGRYCATHAVEHTEDTGHNVGAFERDA